VREKVRKAVQEQKENEVASHLVEELRARARIETFI
jgi:hypothetical protein